MMSLSKLIAFAALGLVVTVAPQAAAQSPVRVDTPEYRERSIDGDQVVTFTGDELAGMSGGAWGGLVVRPPGVVRVGLIRPRLNFVSALVKSVENL